MKKNKLPARILAALLALVLVLSLCPIALAAEDETVSIGSLRQLQAFAKRCGADTYSRGLTVVLTDDIDADGAAVSVPIFLGDFDGQGHKITGLRLTESCSEYGLFSRVESGASVRNLTVEGEVIPAGTQTEVGGIVGENHGTIENCRFSGVVVGSASVGGIAGTSDGTVTGCTVSGVVRGTQYTGGIAGQNAGALLRCDSAAAVNTTVSEADLAAADLQTIESTIYSILKREEVTENAVTTDTGGIAGYSTGVIQSCTNSGTVGYPHVGYNVGGIAGRQNGYLASCTNSGAVQGRKDVGGIVGQMVPDITLRFSSGGLDELQTELNALQSLVNRTLDDAQSASDSVTGGVSRIAAYADAAQSSAGALSGQLTDFVDANVSSVNNLLLIVERYTAKAAPILDDLSSAAGSAADAAAQVRGLFAALDDTQELNEQLLTALQSACTELSAACGSLSAGLDALEQAFALMADGPAAPDTAQLRADIGALQEAVSTLETTVTRALEELSVSGHVTAATCAALKDSLLAVLDGYVGVVRSLADVLTKTDFGALRDENEQTLREILTALQTAMDSFSAASSHLGSAMSHLADALGTLRELNERLADAYPQLDAALLELQRAASSLTRALASMAQWARDLSGEDFTGFSPLGSQFGEDSSALNASLSGVSRELTALNSEISDASTVLLADLRAVNSQFMKVMNLFLNVLNSTQNVDYTDVFEDVSEESLQSAARGKVLECDNYGAVTADRSVGGIAGSMAIEYDLDPEDDLLSSDDRTARFTYQTKAILLDCNNYGAVTAKKSCAGGVTGRMDLGTVSGCGGWGSVTSESGDYVGGVAGLSLSSIRASYAKCSLSGGKYVGGIAGSGSRVCDCISMVEITDCTQLAGAVAGELTGEYSGNRFVSDTLAGVDRVSYAGKAEQIDYPALQAADDVPEELLHLTLRFVADGKVLKRQTFSYGDSFTADDFPEAPKKDGCYADWDVTDLSDLRFDTTVTAVYRPYVTALAAADAEDGRPALLAEGLFRTGDTLQAVQADTADAPRGAAEVWTLTLPADGEESHTIHWRVPADGAKRYTVYTAADGGWKKAQTSAVGSYLCFDLPSESVQFAVVPAAHAAWQLWAAIAAALAAIAAVITLVIRKRRAKAAKRAQ